MGTHKLSEEVKRLQKLAGIKLNEERGYLSQDIDDLIQQGLQADRIINAQN